MVKRKSKTRFNYTILATMIFAVLMIAAFFMHFVTFKTETIIGDHDTHYDGLNIMNGEFPQDSEDPQQVFGNIVLRLGALTSIIGGGALLLILVIALFLPKIKAFITVSKILSLICAVISVLCLIGALIVANKTALSYGTIYDFRLVLDAGLYMFLAGGIGSCVSSILTK